MSSLRTLLELLFVDPSKCDLASIIGYAWVCEYFLHSGRRHTNVLTDNGPVPVTAYRDLFRECLKTLCTDYRLNIHMNDAGYAISGLINSSSQMEAERGGDRNNVLIINFDDGEQVYLPIPQLRVLGAMSDPLPQVSPTTCERRAGDYPLRTANTAAREAPAKAPVSSSSRRHVPKEMENSSDTTCLVNTTKPAPGKSEHQSTSYSLVISHDDGSYMTLFEWARQTDLTKFAPSSSNETWKEWTFIAARLSAHRVTRFRYDSYAGKLTYDFVGDGTPVTVKCSAFWAEKLRILLNMINAKQADDHGIYGECLEKWNKNMIAASINAIVDVATIFGFEPTVQRDERWFTYDTQRYVDRWYSQLPKDLAMESWADLAKYKLVAYYSSQYATPEDQPVCGTLRVRDPADQLLGGRFYRWAYHLKVTDPKMYRSWVLSLTTAKSLMPKLSSFTRKREAKKLYELITAPETIPGDEIVIARYDRQRQAARDNRPLAKNEVLTVESLKYQIKRTIEEVFPDRAISDDDVMKPRVPSMGATFHSTRAKGGSLGDLQEAIRVCKERADVQRHLLNITIEEMYLTRPTVAITHAERRNAGDMAALDQLIADRAVEQSEINLEETAVVDDTPFKEVYSRFLNAVYDTLPAENYVEIHPLSEALKTRCITKGIAGYNYLAKWLQMYMHSRMRTHPCFQLIGRMVDEKSVYPLRHLRLNEGWLSGDYKDATNQMKGWVSRYAFECLADRISIPEEMRPSLRKTLTDHFVCDPDPSPEDLALINEGSPHVGRPQRSAQLMGSIESFPFLCIVNAAMVRWAMELSEGKRLDLRKARLRVNGDDFVACITSYGRDVWRKIISFVGWSESQGKSYYSNEFLQINSAMFVPVPLGLEQVPKLKCGLLAGAGKTGDSSQLNIENIGNAAQSLVEHCPDSIRERAMTYFIRRHAHMLQGAGNRSWFLPPWAGGLGLPGTPSKKDRRVAETILLGGYDVPTFHKEVPSRMHAQVMKRLPCLETVYQSASRGDETQDFERTFSKLYSEIALEVYLTKRLSTYFQKTPDAGQAAEDHNKKVQRLLLSAISGCRGGEGLSDWDLAAFSQKLFYPVFFEEPDEESIANPVPEIDEYVDDHEYLDLLEEIQLFGGVARGV